MSTLKNFDILPLSRDMLDQAEYVEKISLGSEAWTKKGILDTISTNGKYYAATLGGDYVGHGGMTVVLDEAYITNIVIDPKFRRMGAAKLILDKLCFEAQTLGTAFISLEVRESNLAAIGLYKQKGFTPVGFRKNFYRNPNENAVIMTLNF